MGGGGGVYLVPSSLPSSNLCILITACLSRFTIYLYDRTSHVREITFFQHYVTLVTNDIISIWKINMIHVYSLQYLRYSLMNTPDQYQTIKPVCCQIAQIQSCSFKQKCLDMLVVLKLKFIKKKKSISGPIEIRLQISKLIHKTRKHTQGIFSFEKGTLNI